jgi:hypothetical protein
MNPGFDIDTRLRRHGSMWREANQDLPIVRWDAVIPSWGRRVGFAVAGGAVAAAAIIAALVVTRPNHAASPILTAQEGAPTGVVSLYRGRLTFFGFTGAGNAAAFHGRAAAIGVQSDHEAYGAFPVADCRTDIQRATTSPPGQGVGLVQLFPVTTIDGSAESTPMAVSPDGTKLAVVVAEPSEVGTQPTPCLGQDELAVVNLRTKQVQYWAPNKHLDSLTSLQWAPDSQHLAYLTTVACAVCARGVVEATRVLDTNDVKLSLTSAPIVLPALVSGLPMLSPVFWWHGKLAVPVDGSLRLLTGDGGVGSVVAKGFPLEVDTVSSDPTGNHLLLTSGTTTYRWDSGYLMTVHPRGTQPGW